MTHTAPLSDEELIELDVLLQTNEDYLLVDEAHGYITALVIALGEGLDDDQWLFGILGDSMEAVQPKMRELLTRLRDEIIDVLSSGGVFEPLVAEIEDEGEILESYEGWCFGFMMALSVEEESWAELPQNEQDLLMPIAKLALLQEDESADMDDEEYGTYVDLIPGSVGGLYQYFRSKRLS